MDLSQAVAVITGAGSGIGRELAVQLSRQGTRLALNDFNAESLAETCRLVESEGGAAISDAFDVADNEAMQAFAALVANHYGRADIVINNAGVSLGVMKADQIPREDFEWVVNINLWGVINGTMAFLPLLKASQEASLVNVSSSFGLLGVPLQAPYCAAKFAVRGFTESIRLELIDTGICVTLVYPSRVRTNILRNGRHKDEATKEELVRLFEERVSRIDPADMAQAIIRGIVNRQEEILYGRSSKIYSFVSRFVPRFVIRAVARRGLRKIDGMQDDADQTAGTVTNG